MYTITRAQYYDYVRPNRAAANYLYFCCFAGELTYERACLLVERIRGGRLYLQAGIQAQGILFQERHDEGRTHN